MKILILGAGLVGRAIIDDLSGNPQFGITVADLSFSALEKIRKKSNITTVEVDISDRQQLEKLCTGFNLAVNAVPGYLGHATLRNLIAAGCNTVDIAFAAEDFLILDELAKENNVTVVCDMGVAPGMSNLLAAYLAGKLDPAESIAIYVGGLPKERIQPFEYKAVFSPSDLMEEYTRPARFVKDGKLVVKPALSDVELMYFKGIGTLEAFNSDGLRSLITTLKVPDMIEKTLRYPGHIQKVEILRQAGFFNTQSIDVNGHSVIPAELTAKLLFPPIDTAAGEEDITVMKVIARGRFNGKNVQLSYELFDQLDQTTGIHSMARTTGYAASAVVQLIASGKFAGIGVFAPEQLSANEEIVSSILRYQADRGIHYHYSEETI